MDQAMPMAGAARTSEAVGLASHLQGGLTSPCELNCEHLDIPSDSDLTPSSELALCLDVDLSVGIGGAPSAGAR
jgi:hypothetical protein